MSAILLLLYDVLFVLVLGVVVVPICFRSRATAAVLKRNFVGYFSNPTGYVFLCLFVLLTSFAAFWPHEFFNANMANLDQLNKYLPYIMLIFIPAITMSIWAEERRQGTDELLLTLPADDFDIVVGKYLAAAAIFTASLLFSQVSNFLVLASLTLGELDAGLFFSTYIGYWMVGMAMLSVGMVASFLTSNLTVGFILGAAFNAPLVFVSRADVIIPSPFVARMVSSWSLGAQFDDCGRGVLSISSVVYFAALIVAGLYLSMVLIGSRHWSGGQQGTVMLGHYFARTLSLLAIAFGINFVFSNNDWLSSKRHDMTEGKVSSLSGDTKRLIRNLKAEHTISIDAFISGHVPEVYAKTKADLISMLKEFRAMAGSEIRVQINILDETREESVKIAALAEERYGIKPQSVRTRTRGAIKDEDILLAAAFTCGVEKVVVPFFDYGIPVEYELIRSICTVAKKTRKKIGIVRTDAQLFGGFSFAGGRPMNIPKQDIVIELEKQYDVEEISPSNPIAEGTYDVMLVVQPSSLGPEELKNVVAAIRKGQPTAVFEDPRPIFLTSAPATGDPKQPMGGMNPMMGGGAPQPKGDIKELWSLLGLDVPGQREDFMNLYQPDLVWQKLNPYQKLQIAGIPDSWVFCRRDAAETGHCLNPDSPITSGLQEVFFPVPGMIKAAKDSELKFTALCTTNENAGLISFKDFMSNRNQENPMLLQLAEGPKLGKQVLAARIQGMLPEGKKDAGGSSTPADDPLKDTPSSKPATPDADHQHDDHDKTSAAAPASSTNSTQRTGSDDAKAATEEKKPNKPEEKKPTADKKTDKPATKKEDKKEDKKQEEKKPRPIDVVYVCDIDLMISAFLRIRARPGEDEEIKWNFENVTFLLNTVDVLAGDTDYIEIRKRKPRHSSLRMVEVQADKARDEEFKRRQEFESKFKKAIGDIEKENKDAVEKFDKTLKDLQEKQRKEGAGGVKYGALRDARERLEIERERLSRKLEVTREQLKRERDEQIERQRRETDLKILAIKNEYKFWAVALPPIPPLLVALVVFVRRRLREREGIAKSRMR
jgi:ABC-2 type transport system permease protein